MSLYGKMAGGLIALTLVGGSAAYVASAAGSVLEAAEQTAAQLSCYVLREYNGSVALFSDDGTEPIAQYSTPDSRRKPRRRCPAQRGYPPERSYGSQQAS